MASWASKVRPRGPKVSSAPKAERDGDRDADAEPDPREQVAAVGLDQVGDQDADDQGRLEPFAQADQVVGEHEKSDYTATLGQPCQPQAGLAARSGTQNAPGSRVPGAFEPPVRIELTT